MRATSICFCILVGLCLFLVGCKDSSANKFNSGENDQFAGDYENDYGYYDDGYYGEENYYDCEEDYYTANGEWGEYYSGGEWESEYQGDYDEVDYVAYDTCEHGYWYPHEECIGLGE